MSMAMKYAMKKRMAKGGQACSDCAAGNCMAHGGKVDHEKGVHKTLESLDEPGTSGAGFRNNQAKFRRGMAEQFGRKGYDDMADEHSEAAKSMHKEKLSELKSMKKPNLYADGGEVEPPKPPVDPERAKKAEESMRKAFGYSDGGEADDDSGFSDDMVGRIMKHRFSKGEEEPVADFESNDFDYLDQIGGDHEADYDEENSGDDIGNEAEDDDQHDVVKRIMKSRSKKDKMPRPA